eukprot:CAMPEP_0172090854 /NCGR_PEP_ID=MMETSP1043-20130122/24593_1 /TAXON_ID=464988 /ORGANISM="Hemiselmis andersenii, Strain CCMP441" /LENGTH=62 /DNA_ID=CAMNT_0012753461 /DNA_START=44 /DNA_END=229 /DNA_ORIENTATION=+
MLATCAPDKPIPPGAAASASSPTPPPEVEESSVRARFASGSLGAGSRMAFLRMLRAGAAGTA